MHSAGWIGSTMNGRFGSFSAVEFVAKDGLNSGLLVAPAMETKATVENPRTEIRFPKEIRKSNPEWLRSREYKFAPRRVYQTKPFARRASSRFRVQGFKVVGNYETKPNPEQKPETRNRNGFSPNEPIARRAEEKRERVLGREGGGIIKCDRRFYQTNPPTANCRFQDFRSQIVRSCLGAGPFAKRSQLPIKRTISKWGDSVGFPERLNRSTGKR